MELAASEPDSARSVRVDRRDVRRLFAGREDELASIRGPGRIRREVCLVDPVSDPVEVSPI